MIAGIEGVEINGGRDGAVPSGDGQSVKQESVVFGNLMNGNGIITSKCCFKRDITWDTKTSYDIKNPP